MSSPKWLYSKSAETVKNEMIVDDDRRNQSHSGHFGHEWPQDCPSSTRRAANRRYYEVLGSADFTPASAWPGQPNERATIRTKQNETQ